MKEKKNPVRDLFYPPGKLPLEDLTSLLSRYTQADPRLVVKPGIGRDACVLSFGDRYLVAKTDPVTFASDEIGWYAVQVNANDIASMGGIPRWFLAALLLPEGRTNLRMVEKIFDQISRACQDLGIVLCGGHTEITLAWSGRSWWDRCWGKRSRGCCRRRSEFCPAMKSFLPKGSLSREPP